MAEYQLDAQGYIIRNDPHDHGARMKPAADGVVYEHPEDAHSPAPKRGDYTGRVQPRSGWRRSTRNIFGERVVDGRGGVNHG